jgi:polar amino acid transport system substrate-binding protein
MKHFLAAFALIILLHPVNAASEQVLSVGTAAGPPYVTYQGRPGFLDVLLKEALGEHGMVADVHSLPGERALINANEGIEDADAMRIPGIEKKYTNLLRVPTSFHTMEFVAFAHNPLVEIRDESDFDNFEVGIIRGWKIYEDMMHGKRNVTIVNDARQLFHLLVTDRIELALFERWQAAPIVAEMGEEVVTLPPILAAFPMYMYLNDKHADLVPKIDRAFQRMNSDGSLDVINTQTLDLWKRYISQ